MFEEMDLDFGKTLECPLFEVVRLPFGGVAVAGAVFVARDEHVLECVSETKCDLRGVSAFPASVSPVVDGWREDSLGGSICVGNFLHDEIHDVVDFLGPQTRVLFSVEYAVGGAAVVTGVCGIGGL